MNTTSDTNGRFSRFRAIAECCLYGTIAVVVVQTWVLDGLIVPYRIAGGSMAETLLGVHRDIACVDCGHSFSCDAETFPMRPIAVCPNCGYAGNRVESAQDLAGDRVWIDRASYRLFRPQRWELAAFRRSSQPDAMPDTIVVKRVVGLPGESVQIRDGDLFVDGCIQRKSLAQQRAMAVLVHDADCEPSQGPTLPRRWRADSDGTRWNVDAGRFVHPATPRESIDWLTYHHQRRLSGEEGRVEESPVADLCGYNQSRPRRQEDVHSVADVLLSVRLAEVTGQGTLVFRATDGVESFEASLCLGGEESRYRVFRGGKPEPEAAGDIPGLTRPSTIELSLFDQQFLLVFDGQTIVALPYERLEPASPPARPLAIGVQGLGVVLGNLRVYRDVYYTRPIGPCAHKGLDEPLHLSEGEYFVLGDNSPISEDSRTWLENPTVGGGLLLGKPLAARIPSRGVQIGPWHFQVPNWTRIRYIH